MDTRLIFSSLAGLGVWLFGSGMAIAETIFPPIQQWTYDSQQQVLQIRTHDLALPKYFLLKEPNRIVLDVLDTSWGDGTVTESYGGTVSQVRVAQFSDGITRFVLNWSGSSLPSDNRLQLRSFPQGNDSVLWQLSLGNTATQPSNNDAQKTANPLDFPPALLPPPASGSVTVPPIPNNLRK